LDKVLADADPKALLDANNCACIFLRVVFDELKKEGEDPRLVAYALWGHLTYLLAKFGMTVEQLNDDVFFFAHKRAAANDDDEKK